MAEDDGVFRRTARALYRGVAYSLIGLTALTAMYGADKYFDVKHQHRRTGQERREAVERYVGDEFITSRQDLEEEIVAGLEAVEARYGWHQFERGDDDIDITELNVINTLLDGLQDEETVNRLGELVAKDLQNGEVELYGVTTGGEEGRYTVDADRTELGGLVTAEGEELVFKTYEPDFEWPWIRWFRHTYIKDLDWSYNPSDEMLADEALGWFHLHASDEDGEGFDRPSGTQEDVSWLEDEFFSDLALTRNLNTSGVLVSYTGHDDADRIVVEVQFYEPDGEVVDLGTYTTDVVLEEEGSSLEL